MRKRFLNIFMIFIFVLSCGFLTACEGRYKNMEFEIQYAFADENGKVDKWLDAGQTLSLNFGNENDKLIIDGNGSNLIFKVNVKNVKAKYIDDIVVYDSNTFTSQIVRQGENFSIEITGAMQSSLRIYETKSGKETNFRLNIFESLENITTNKDFKPALVVGKTVNLNNLSSANENRSALLFSPVGTNQTAVDFSIVGLGYYDGTQWNETRNATSALQYVQLNNDGVLTIKDNYDANTNPVLKLKATSRYYKDKDEISTTFDVYIIESLTNVDAPVVSENGKTTKLESKILYVNDDSENKEYRVIVDVGIGTIESKYIKGVTTANGDVARYGLDVYVDEELVDMDDYADHKGIRIQPLETSKDKAFLYEITADEKTYLTYPINIIRFELKVLGLDYVIDEQLYSASLQINKRSIVKDITLNGETAETFTEGKIYSTANANVTQTGLNLFVDITPNDGASHLVLVSASANLNVTGKSLIQLSQPQTINGKTYTLAVMNGTNINVNFKQNVTVEDESISFTTYKKIEDPTAGYVDAYSIDVKKVVTANRFEILSSSTGAENFIDKTILTNAQTETNFYLRVYYSGNNLATETIDLTLPTNSKFSFKNGAKAINLKNDFTSAGVSQVSSKVSVGENGEYYDLYCIPVKPTNDKDTALVSITAGKTGNTALFEANFTLQSVFVAESNEFVIRTEGQNIFKIDATETTYEKFAIVNNYNIKSEMYFGQIVGGQFEQLTVANVSLERAGKADSTDFSSLAVDYLALGKVGNTNKFQMWGVQGSKTTHFTATITYYTQVDGVIASSTANKEFEIAVYNNINDIDIGFVAGSNNEIVYINKYYESSASTTIKFNAKSFIATPSSSVKFGAMGEEITVADINKLKLNVAGDFRSVKILVNNAEINFDDNGNAVDAESNKIYLSNLTDTITVKLIKKPETSQQFVTLTLSAVSFNTELPVSKAITINFGSYIQSNDIALSGEDLVTENGTINVNMSFINVADGGIAVSNFNAEVIYNQLVDKKYDDLDYILYEILQDDKGNPILDANKQYTTVELSKAENRLNIAINKAQSLVSIGANKSLGGGMFKLRLVALDSYDEATDKFTNYRDVFINITDGSVKARYKITSADDFRNIANNLNANYVLTKDIIVTNHTTFDSFSGSLSGKDVRLTSAGGVVETKRCLTITICNPSTSTDNVYYGIFTKLVGEAIITDLNINAKFANNLTPTSTDNGKSLYIGGLAGIVESQVQIKNVQVDVDFAGLTLINTTEKINISTDVYIGGVAGEMSNNFDISSSKITTKGIVYSAFKASQKTLYFGGVAGILKGSLVGNYAQTSDLENLSYNVGVDAVLANADMSNNLSNRIENNVLIGLVAGYASNSAIIQGFVAMGQINANNLKATGYLSGIAGKTDNVTINKIVLIGVNLSANTANLSLAGAIGESANTTISNLKFLSFKLEDSIDTGIKLDENKSYGAICNAFGLVAGLVANAGESTVVTLSSVENYVKDKTFMSLQGKQVYGLAKVSGSNVEISKCFVNANILANNAETSYLLANMNAGNCYFIGRFAGNRTTATGTNIYTVVYDDSSLFVNDIEVASFDAYSTTEENKLETGVTGENWIYAQSFNTLSFGGYKFYLPYLKDNYTLIPTDITTLFNQETLENIKSLYVGDFDKNEETDKKDELNNIVKHQITETAIINYYNDINNPLNNYNLNTHNLSDLVTLSKVPNSSDTIGAIVYKIIKGADYASIVNNTQIYFKGVSGQDYILIKAYSVFNPDACDYFLIYTQNWFSNIVLEADNLQAIGSTDETYQLDTYKGVQNLEVEIKTVNSKPNDATIYKSLFDVDNIGDYVEISSITEANSAVTISKNPNLFNRFVINSKDVEIERLKTEVIIFNIKLNLTKYFGETVYPQIESKDQYLTLASRQINLNISETATDLEFTTEHMEGESSEAFVLTATLSTGFVQGDVDFEEKVNIVQNKEIVEFDEPNHDSLIMTFTKLDGQNEFNRLLKQANVNYIPELLDIEVFNSYDASAKTYSYRIALQLKDSYNTRYLTDAITIGIKLCAKTNPSIDGGTIIQLTINPSKLSTSIVMNNYAASTAESMGNYTHLITSSQVETANITPGGNGGVLIVRMQPSYAYIKQATLKSSELYVPSLNQNVKVRFEQLVYHTGLGKYISISPSCEQTEDGLGVFLHLASQTTDGVNYIYDGTIYIHVVLDKKFSGLADEIRLTLDVTNADDSHIIKTKSLVTDYLPGVELSYDENYKVATEINGNVVEGYLVQQNTSNNIVTLKIFGYQFNANPTVNISYYDGTNVGTEIDYQWLDKYTELKQNADGSYTMRLQFAVRDNISKAFKVSVAMSLASNNEIKTEGQELVFFPTQYILDISNTKFEFGTTLNLAINQARDLTFAFATNNTSIDFSTEIYKILIKDLKESIKSSAAEGTTYTEDELAGLAFKKLMSLFSFKADDTGLTSTFDKRNEFFDVFTTNYGSVGENQTYLRLKAKGQFETSVQFKIYYNYVYNTEDNIFELVFGTADTNTYPHVLTINFDMNFYTATTRQDAFAISSAEQMFDANGNCILGEGQNYVLTDDIVVEIVKPITTAIASLDGNNKKIKIKNFVVDATDANESATTYYGLFASVSENTLLYNVVVDYSEFNTTNNGQLVLAYENINDIVFGGLTAVNNGLIYNCDVVNASSSSTKVINLLVNNNASTCITFGGLVGVNNGTITNSRVGRSNFTKIIANDNAQTSYNEEFKPLNFIIGNRTLDAGQGFKSTIGGFVGVNNADNSIASSYVVNTSLYTYSTNKESKLAGFVAENAGKISYSYVKGLESTITNENPFATGSKIEAHADGNIAGFVYDNLSGGDINNSFANIELVSKSAFMAGFVFRNNSGAKVAQCYASCTFANANRDTSLQITPEQPFVGADTTGLLSNGEMENCYWYKDTSKQQFVIAEDGDKPNATGLNATNFADTTNLINFVFVLSNSKNDREQGIWSFYDNKGNAVKLPELTIANNIAHSFRYETTTSTEQNELSKYTYATKFMLGGKNNPEIISSVQEFNDVFTSYGTNNKFVGYVRFIADIDFASDKAAIATRRQFSLGNKEIETSAIDSYTSVDGNGMSINNIYLDVGEDKEEMVGLFANINRAYVKNLNLNFSTGNFSTANSVYSGGLAGRITDSVIININLNGKSTTIQGANMVGGLAGLIDGQSLIYGISSNLSVSTILSGTTELYNSTKNANDKSYATKVSYAGGIAGVVDLSARAYTKEGYNLSYLYVNDNGVDKNDTLSIVADYAGGAAGYIGKAVKSVRVSFNIGANNRIDGQYSAGGLYGASIGASLEASKVSALDTDDAQFKYDNTLAKYILDMSKDLDTENIGNASLIESYTYGGGLIGISVGSSIFSCYSKASFYAGKIIGGLIGIDVLSNNNFNYAVPFLNFEGNMETLSTVGGLIGIVEDAGSATFGQVYTSLNKPTTASNQNYTFSTILADDSAYAVYKQNLENEGETVSLNLNNFVGIDRAENRTASQVYTGNIAYSNLDVQNTIIPGLTVKDMRNLYNLEVPEVQLSTYNAIFSIWDTRYWNLDTHSHYFPLLTDERDENYEIIKDFTDFEKIKNNPTGSFKIIDDIDMKNVQGENYVFDYEFEGVLVGEKADGSTPVVYNLNITASQNADAGLFKATNHATFRNIEFSWAKYGVGGEGNAVKIKNFAGFSGNDVKSKISAVKVTVGRTNGTETDSVELFGQAGKEPNIINSSITGFAGLISTATGTNLINSSFSGLVNATIDLTNSNQVENYVGGLVGYGETDTDDIENIMSIVNCTVGVVQTTEFKLVLKGDKQLDIGLLAGDLNLTAVTGNSVGSLYSSSVSKNIKMGIDLNGFKGKLYASGLIGVVENCNIEDNTTLHSINITASNNADNKDVNIYLAGLIGKYLLGAENTGRKIANCKVNTSLISEVKGITYASAGVAYISTINTVNIEQCLFNGAISTNGNAYVGAVVAYAPKSAGQQTKVMLNQIVSNIDIKSAFGGAVSSQTPEGNQSTAPENVYVGGLVGKVEGVLTLANTMNMGKITPVANGDVCYYIGGLAGNVDNVVLTNGSYSFCLSSILSAGLTTEAITQVKPTAENPKFRNMGALFGCIGKTSDVHDNLYVGRVGETNFYSSSADKNTLSADIFYSTDMALVAEDSILGTNLTAGTLINSVSYQTKALETGMWTNTASSNANIPYLTSMRTAMRQFEIMENATDDYKSGLVANPKRSYTNTEQIYYYLVGSSFKITDTFNGIAVGDGSIINTVDSFYVKNNGSSVNSDYNYSAISNIHINYENADVANPLVEVNSGVIFNCSITGNVNSVADSTGQGTGLLVNDNNGLIIYCFNSADTTSAVKVSALARNNYATISSCYFTGTITITELGAGIYGYAIAENSVTNVFVYNCYTAGNINSINASSFVGTNVNAGCNNFIDSFATPSDNAIEQTNLETLKIGLVSTYDLMSNKNDVNLDGNWQTAVSGKMFDLNDGSMFGYNYNYPIYNFNLFSSLVEGSIEKLPLTTYSRKTGRGQSQEDWFEINHFGVLRSVQGVVANIDGANRYYKFTRDLDGGIYEQYGTGLTGRILWSAVGAGDSSLGFDKVYDDSFTGTFEGEYGTNPKTKHTIANIKTNGLFTNISSVVYNGLKFIGIFEDLENSGALGMLVSGTVKVTNVDVGDLTVSGSNASILFGEMSEGTIYLGDEGENGNYKPGILTVGTRQDSFGVPALQTKKAGSYALIASTIRSGTIEIYDQEYNLYTEFDETVRDRVDNANNIFGGLVGTMYAGEINSKLKTKLNIKSTNYDIFGGLVGKIAESSSEMNSLVKVNNFNVKFTNDTFSVNQFGGLVGEISGKTQLVNCTLGNQADDTARQDLNLSFANGSNRYFGLLAGRIVENGSLEISGAISNSTFDSVLIIQGKDGIGVETSQGFGSLVGELNVVSGNKLKLDQGVLSNFSPRLIVINCYNVGGLIGYYGGGTIDIPKPKKISIQGSNNVGGAIGYATATINCAENGGWNLMEGNGNLNDTNNAFASIDTTLILGAKIKNSNWGGLIGKAGANCEINNFINYNEIKFEPVTNGTTFNNIGGVVGYTLGKVYNSTNTGKITIKCESGTTGSIAFNEDFFNIIFKGSATEITQAKETAKPINVGGIAGKTGTNSKIEGCVNLTEIQGYQSVGGLVGYAGGFVGFAEISKTDLSGTEYSYDSATDKYIAPQDNDEKYYSESTVSEDAIIRGVINVGGAVGYLAPNAKLRGVICYASVYGNTNIGGIVGLTGNGCVITNTTFGTTQTSSSFVSAILVHNYVELDDEGKSYYTIPTSVGGLIGSTAQNTTRVEDNNVYATIDSASEGAEIVGYQYGENQGSNVISTISNYMFGPIDTEGLTSLNFTITDVDAKDKIEKQKIEFNSVKSGFGGLIGTTSTKTTLYFKNSEYSIQTNTVATTINAPLGINVGVHYGYYGVESGTGKNITLPTISLASSVSGAYNIGGAIGYFDGSKNQQVFDGYTYSPEKTIEVQKDGTAMYVGGVFGKVSDDLSSLSTNNNIKIYTDNSYYIGGLVGRLEGNLYTDQTNPTNATNIQVEYDNVLNLYSNFGGLVGMLKVAKSQQAGEGITVTVKGTHYSAFTINTIENQNYTDIDPDYKAMTDNENYTVTLYAIARYQNNDSFDISASQKTFTHNPLDNDTVDVNGNPISTSPGWHKSYTGFKTLQRFISKEENNGANWDSIATIYDASKIKRVELDNGNIKFTIYEDYPNIPILYSKSGWAQIYRNPGNVNEEDNTITNTGKIEKPEKYSDYEDKFEVVENFYYLDEDDASTSNDTLGSYKIYDQIYFEYKVKYTSEADSGSMFDVIGTRKSTFQSYTADQQDAAVKAQLGFWKALLIGTDIVSFIFIIGSLFTAGTSAAGAAAIQVGVKAGIKAIVKAGLKGFLKGMFKKLFTKTMIKRIFAYFTVMIAMNGILQAQTMSYQTTATILQNIKGEIGYLSNMYYRDINYNADGKFEATADNVKVFDGYPYQLYSTTRPNDYYQNYWIAIQPESGLSKCYSIKLYLTEADVKVKAKQDFNCSADANITILKSYIYSDGAYWVNALSSDKYYEETSLIANSDYYLGKKEEPYMYFDNYTYVYGKYEDNDYQFESRTDGNNLTYDGTNYSLNGNPIASEKVIKTTDVYYKRRASKLDETEKNQLIEGYDYFTGAYNTVSGNSEMESNRYGVFEYDANFAPEGYTIDVDYVIRPRIYVDYELNSAGSYYFENGEYKQIPDKYITRYSYDSGNNSYLQDDNGIFYKFGNNYYNIPEKYLTRYQDVTKTDYDACYKITNIQISDEDITSSSQDKYIIKLFPFSFKDPYTIKLNNRQDGYDYVYDSSNSSKSIKAEVTYYLWDGGYQLNGSNVLLPYAEIYSVYDKDNDKNKNCTDLSGYQISFDDQENPISLSQLYKVDDDNSITYIAQQDYLYEGLSFKDNYILKFDSSGYLDQDGNFVSEGNDNYRAKKFMLYKKDVNYCVGKNDDTEDKTLYYISIRRTFKEQENDYNKYRNVTNDGKIEFYTKYKFSSNIFDDFQRYTIGNDKAFANAINSLLTNPWGFNVPNFSFQSELCIEKTGEKYSLLKQNNGYRTVFCESASVMLKSEQGGITVT